MKTLAATLMLLLLLVPSSSSDSEAILDCKAVTAHLTPCLTYLTGMVETPRAFCCKGARIIVLGASTNMENKKMVCNCIKTLAYIVKPRPENAIDLSNKCRIHFPFEISPNIDCSRYSSKH
ncbi:non-specific lipid-transfer protein 1-like [Vicia villosa]|uniref:non-specific lipid-transfer protein 1-like n=1 Tax=Vicia villosa TaxID=3911 RepID=UPI00273B6198|nr:non-specific lipid-transfer protein 1-like [Vicia villosa]